MIRLFNDAFKDIRKNFIYSIWLDISYRIWEKKGRPIPPPHAAKANIVREYARQFSIDILIEAGTYTGNMIFSMNNIFSQIFPIELNNNLYQKTKEKFAKYPIFISYKEIVPKCCQK